MVPLRDDDGRDGCDFRQITEIPTIQEIVEEQEVPEVLVLAGKVMGEGHWENGAEMPGELGKSSNRGSWKAGRFGEIQSFRLDTWTLTGPLCFLILFGLDTTFRDVAPQKRSTRWGLGDLPDLEVSTTPRLFGGRGWRNCPLRKEMQPIPAGWLMSARFSAALLLSLSISNRLVQSFFHGAGFPPSPSSRDNGNTS